MQCDEKSLSYLRKLISINSLKLANQLGLDRYDVEQDLWLTFLRRYKPIDVPISFKTRASRLVGQIARDLKSKYLKDFRTKNLDPELLPHIPDRRGNYKWDMLDVQRLPEHLRPIVLLSMRHPWRRVAYYLRISERRYWRVARNIVKLLQDS